VLLSAAKSTLANATY